MTERLALDANAIIDFIRDPKFGRPPSTQARLNDLWIAAICIEHRVPLLTSDHGFDVIPGLEVLHW